MLSAVLRSETAIQISIKIMDAFVEMRRFLYTHAQVFDRLDSVERKQHIFESETEKNFEKVFQALEKSQELPLIVMMWVVTLCEMKYSDSPFVVDKNYACEILRKISVYQKQASTRQKILFSIISPYGVKPSIYSEELIHGLATMENLFKGA